MAALLYAIRLSARRTRGSMQVRLAPVSVRALPGSGGMGCRVTTSAKSGKWQLVTDYITDPARNTLLMNVSFKTSVAKGLRLYVRFDPTVNGNGGGGSGNGGADSAVSDISTGHPILVADDPSTTTNAANRDYGQPVYLALDAPFTTELTNGFAGSASDGLVELDGAHALTTSYPAANNGNVVSDPLQLVTEILPRLDLADLPRLPIRARCR